jgi:hypothetical protein
MNNMSLLHSFRSFLIYAPLTKNAFSITGNGQETLQEVWRRARSLNQEVPNMLRLLDPKIKNTNS